MTTEARENILQTARLEFAEYGLAGARVDRIAKRAKVNKAMIYYHFRSKERLYQAVIDSHLEQIGTFIESGLSGDTDPETFLLELSEFYHRVAGEENSNTFVPIILREIAAGGERIKAALATIIAKKGLPMRLKKMIDRGVDSGVFRPVDGRHAIISFVGMNLLYLLLAPAINSLWEIKNEKKFRRDRPKIVVDLFLNGLKVR